MDISTPRVTCQQMMDAISRSIPITVNFGLVIETLTMELTRVSAPLDCNYNIHGTAFAGSLYSVGVLSCWSAVQMMAMMYADVSDVAAFHGHVVAKNASIRYRKPVNNDFVCDVKLTNVPKSTRDAFGDAVKSNTKSQPLEDVPVYIYIRDGDNTGLTPAAEMMVTFVYVP